MMSSKISLTLEDMKQLYVTSQQCKTSELYPSIALDWMEAINNHLQLLLNDKQAFVILNRLRNEKELIVLSLSEYKSNTYRSVRWVFARKDGMSFIGEGNSDLEALIQVADKVGLSFLYREAEVPTVEVIKPSMRNRDNDKVAIILELLRKEKGLCSSKHQGYFKDGVSTSTWCLSDNAFKEFTATGDSDLKALTTIALNAGLTLDYIEEQFNL